MFKSIFILSGGNVNWWRHNEESIKAKRGKKERFGSVFVSVQACSNCQLLPERLRLSHYPSVVIVLFPIILISLVPRKQHVPSLLRISVRVAFRDSAAIPRYSFFFNSLLKKGSASVFGEVHRIESGRASDCVFGYGVEIERTGDFRLKIDLL